MKRKPILLAVGGVLLALILGGTLLALVLRHVPDFYTRAAVAPGEQRKQWSREFQSEFWNKLVNYLINEQADDNLPADLKTHGNDAICDIRFTEEQINSYFEEDFIRSGYTGVLPEGVSAPRVAIEADRLRVGFRCGTKPWSTVISLDLRIWLVAKEPNVVAIEVRGLHAGALPISVHTIMDRLTEVARDREIDVNWYRYNGNPVALLRRPAGKKDSAVVLQQLKLQPKTIVMRFPVGRLPARASLTTSVSGN
jgi:hypothetical protein